VAIFAGYDLDVLADYKNAPYLATGFYQASSSYARIIPHFVPQLFFKKVIEQQRQGIKRADIVNYYSTGINPDADKLLNDIKAGQTFKRLEYRGFDCDKFPYREPVIENKKFTILNITRFFYLTKRNDNKRNDIMIKGIGRFLKANKFTPADVEILFFEKGDDTAAAKILCDQHGLTPFIQWQQQTSAEDLNNYFARCDVAFDQLGEQWIGAGLFSMLTGRPVIANGRPEVFENLFKEKSPVCQATTEQEVEIWLTKLYHNRQLVKTMGMASREYVLKHYSIAATVDYYIKNLDLL
jgi:glycosyltransferase involved in cell wall biosynthesis